MEYMPDFKLHRPRNKDDAARIKSESSESLFVAGGTDMIVNVRRGIEQPKNLIDLSDITEVKEINQRESELVIGSGVTLDKLANSEKIKSYYPAIADAALSIAGSTHQKYGTVGGNICLDTRCLFYNQSEWWRQSNDYCMKERGDICHVAPGGKRCFAAFSGDLAPAMLVYNAEIKIFGPNGERQLTLQDLYRNDGMNHLTLESDELIASIHLPNSLAGSPSKYEKARIRGSIDFPLAGAAVRLEKANNKITDITVALTGVNPFPQIIKNTEAMIGMEINEQTLDQLRENVRKQAKPMKTTTVAPWYRRRVVGAIARRLTYELSIE